VEALPVFSRLVEELARGRLLLTVLNVEVSLYVWPGFNGGSAAYLCLLDAVVDQRWLAQSPLQEMARSQRASASETWWVL